MGMTRAVGLGFLLLIVVSHAAVQYAKRRAISNLPSNEYYLAEGETRKTINGVKVGDKIYFVTDAKSTYHRGSITIVDKWIPRRGTASFLRLGTETQYFRSSDDNVSSLLRMEVVPMKSGTLMFSLKKGRAWKTVTLSVSQGSVVFVIQQDDSDVMEVEIPRNKELTVYAEYTPRTHNWIIDSVSGVSTTPITEATGFENGGPYLPLKTFSVTPTGNDLHSVTLKLKKMSDNSVSMTRTINITVK